MNPLSNMFGNRSPAPQPQNNPMNNFMDTMNRFNQFRQNFTGDPRQAVMNLLSSGQMSQQQFNQLSQMARMFQNRG